MRSVSVFVLSFSMLLIGCSGSSDAGLADEVRLDSPTSLAAVRIGVTSVQLTWVDKALGEDGFAIERQRGAGSFVPLLFAPVDATQVVDSLGLAIDSSYSYRVRAFRYVTSSGYSNTVSVQLSLPFP